MTRFSLLSEGYFITFNVLYLMKVYEYHRSAGGNQAPLPITMEREAWLYYHMGGWEVVNHVFRAP